VSDALFSAIRGRRLAGKITEQRAHDALLGLAGATIERIPVAPLLGRLWELRSNVSGHDARYVAVAEVLGCPLVTADARLARVAGLECEVRLALPNAEG
jgi:predicted nucleic acid-binding protein